MEITTTDFRSLKKYYEQGTSYSIHPPWGNSCGVCCLQYGIGAKSAPDADVISLSFDKDDTGGEVDPKKPYQCWWSPDRLMYYWFRRTQPDYKRYLLCEDDTYFNQHPREFFGPTWDGDAVGGVVVNANLPGLYHDGFATHKYWCGVEAERSGFATAGHFMNVYRHLA